MGELLEDYRARGRHGDPLADSDLTAIKLFGELYPTAYEPGALTARTKELIALGLGLVRGCDDCTTYHLLRVAAEGGRRDEVFETLGLVLVVGGSALIPALRRAAFIWQEIEAEAAEAPPHDGSATQRGQGSR